MNPNIWGPQLWFSLHIITLNYPNNPNNKDKTNFKNFFETLINVIPCNYCKHNFRIHMNKLPIDNALNNNNSLVKWLFDIHNLTNKHLNKKIFTYQEFISKYKTILQKKNIYNYNYICYFIIFIIVIIFIIILYYIYYKYYNKSIYFP
tara:strand:- start:228 stop:671 length:444 start_codon:yes stop_codon:yes gene_type:complete